MAEPNKKTRETIEHLVDEEGNKFIINGREKWLGENSGTITEYEDPEDETPDVCKVTPVEAYMTTNLNNRTTSYEKLATRILNFLGWPAVAVTDIHSDQLYTAIGMAVEMFTRYGGYTIETMVFDSRLYEENKGIRLDKLYTVASTGAVHKNHGKQSWINRGPDQLLKAVDDVYVTRKPIAAKDYYISEQEFNLLQENCKKVDRDLLCYLRDISIRCPKGIEELSVISGLLYEFLIESGKYHKDDFKKSRDKVVTEGGEELTIYMQDEKLGRIRDPLYYENMYDYDMLDYRKVRGVINFVEGTSNALDAILSQPMTTAEQSFHVWTYNNRGFGLLERYCLDEFVSARNKILAMDKSWYFNPDTQYFTITPQPKPGRSYTGIIEAYVEKPIKHIITDPWIFKYALAIVKTMIGNVRGKWGDVQLTGGGVISGNRFTQEGLQEMEKLEQMLKENGAYGGVPRPLMFIG